MSRHGKFDLNYKEIANSHKSLQRGMVWCLTCGRSQKVDSAGALRNGWPKCCGYTMTIDSPDERSARSMNRSE